MVELGAQTTLSAVLPHVKCLKRFFNKVLGCSAFDVPYSKWGDVCTSALAGAEYHKQDEALFLHVSIKENHELF